MKNYLIVIASVLLMIGCTESGDMGKATLNVHLTDAPADFDQVLVDVQEVKICIATEDSGNWFNLPLLNPGVYNLLDFTNGMDTLLGSIELPAGKISQMRLVLGPNNHLVKDSITYDLDTPSAMQSGLKFNVNTTLSSDMDYDLWIDFDAGRSIVSKGHGGFSLKPVIRTFTKALNGSIDGITFPAEATPYIMAIAGEDTVTSTIAAENGKFLLRGISGGTYKIVFKPKSGYMDKILENIEVTNGLVTHLDTVKLQMN